jgi:cytoskeletal protein RodZ
MESIGEKLRLAREKNNYTIEQISRDTHVAKRFLKALEDEDFAVFPGETYAMGFLRNYAEYLGLNAEELAGLYKNLKIQEQPLPMAELLEPKPKLNLRMIAIIGVVAIVVLGGAAFIVFRLVSSRGGGTAVSQRQALVAAQGGDFVFQEEVRTKWFSQGEAFIVPVGGKSYRIELTAIGETLAMKVPGGTVDLTIGKERLIDLDGDSKADVKVVWNDVDRTSPQKRANLELHRVTAMQAEVALGAAVEAGQTPADGGAATTAATAAAQPGTGPASTATQQTASSLGATSPATTQAAAAPAAQTTPPLRGAVSRNVQVSRAAETSPFTMDIVFRDYCLFRYQTDSKDREEKFFQKGESFSLDARGKITLWLSNAGAVKAKISGKDVDLGNPGEVAVRQIAWVKDAASGEYVLEVTALY